MKAVAVLVLVVSLAGCSAAPKPAPAPATSAPATSAPAAQSGGLLPAVGPIVTAETASAEGTRLAESLQTLIDGIVNVNDNSQLVPADAETAAYYAVYRTLSLETAADPLIMGAQLTTVLQDSGWQLYETTNLDGQYLAALSSGETGWFALIGGDASVEGQSVVTFQIASPDIP